jgi:protein-L-isoaspartate(D-aspartate) O-methyltransferase
MFCLWNAVFGHMVWESVLPAALVEQLKPGGRMVIPVGTMAQDLVIVDKLLDGTIKKKIEIGVRYVPLI